MTAHKANGSDIIPQRVRDYLYPVALAALAVAGGYGLLSDQEIAVWGALVAAILGLGTATAYRPAKSVEPLERQVEASYPAEPGPVVVADED